MTSLQNVNSVSICARAQQGVVFELTSSSNEISLSARKESHSRAFGV